MQKAGIFRLFVCIWHFELIGLIKKTWHGESLILILYPMIFFLRDFPSIPVPAQWLQIGL